MFKYFIILIGFLFTDFNAFSQDTVTIDNHEYVLFKPSKELTTTIQNGLQIRYTLIKLKTHPKMNLSEKEYHFYTRLMDTLVVADDVEFTDSVSIVLKNGLSWKLNGDPPSEPKNFYSKVTTKKGQDRPVMDRLKYLQFCYSWKQKGKLPFDMVNKIVDYQRIEIEGVKYIEILYELKFNADGSTSFSEKNIVVGCGLD